MVCIILLFVFSKQIGQSMGCLAKLVFMISIDNCLYNSLYVINVIDQQKSTTLKIDALVTSSPSLSADLKAILGPDCLVRI